MTLSSKIQLIDDLIKENPEYTIRDYLETLQSIETVETTQSKEMNTPKHYTAEDAEFIIKHHEQFTARAIAIRLGLPEEVVRNFGSRHNLTFAKAPYERKVEVVRKVMPVKEEKRPDAVYSNSGFLSTSQKYAS